MCPPQPSSRPPRGERRGGRHRLGRVWTVFRIGGAAALAHKARMALFSRSVFARLALDLDAWVPPSATPAYVTVTRLDREELVAWRQPYPLGTLPEEFYADHLYGASEAWLTFIEGDVGGILWIFGPGDRALVRLGPNERELRLLYISPPFRGRGISVASMSRVTQMLQSEGIRLIYAHVLLDNTISLRAFRRLGWRPIAVIELTRALGHQRSQARPLSQGMSFDGAWAQLHR